MSLLLFEAADCLMALPAWEVARLVPSALDLWSEDPEIEKVGIDLLDLDAHFGVPSQTGPWIEWFRGEESRGLRVQRVLEVWLCPVRNLMPVPLWLRSAGWAGPFLAVGMREEEIFLLLDPARLAPVESGSPGTTSW